MKKLLFLVPVALVLLYVSVYYIVKYPASVKAFLISCITPTVVTKPIVVEDYIPVVSKLVFGDINIKWEKLENGEISAKYMRKWNIKKNAGDTFAKDVHKIFKRVTKDVNEVFPGAMKPVKKLHDSHKEHDEKRSVEMEVRIGKRNVDGGEFYLSTTWSDKYKVFDSDYPKHYKLVYQNKVKEYKTRCEHVVIEKDSEYDFFYTVYGWYSKKEFDAGYAPNQFMIYCISPLGYTSVKETVLLLSSPTELERAS